MIEINKEFNTFHLYNNKMSLFLYVNQMKHIETIYFGEFKSGLSLDDKLQFEDNWSTSFYDTKIKKEFVIDKKSSNRLSRFEIGTHGLADNRPATLIFQKENGNYETNLEYISYKIFKGYPKYKNIPHAQNGNVDTIQFILRDEFNPNIEVNYNISIDNDKNVIVKNFEVNNIGDEKVKILKASSLCLDLISDQYDVHHFAGRWGRERREKINPIIDGEQIIASNYGRSSHEENPFVFFTNRLNNEVIGFNLIYSGNFMFSIFNDFQNSPRITYGLNDYNFGWILSKGETFITPQAVISYSNDGTDEMSHNFHEFICKNLMNFKNKDEYRPLLFNSWEGCEMTFNTNSVISYIDDCAKIGSELFVLDDGWFSTRDNEYLGLGDWWVNAKKINLEKVIDHCHTRGLKFGIWFEPEMVNYNSELFDKHPEYVIGLDREKVSLHRHQLMLDFTNPEVVDYIYKQMCDVIDKYKIDYIKWDHNRDLKECYVPRLGKDKQGEVTHRMVLGYYDLLERITKRYPDIMIEGCASGGGRFDLGTLYYCPQIWCSDNTDPLMRLYIQYNTSFGYPLSSMGSHVSKSETANYVTKANLALFGTYGYEMNPNNLKEDEIKNLSFMSEIYKKYHKDYFDNGILYHLMSPETSNFMSLQVKNKSIDSSIVLLISKDTCNSKNIKLNLKGLNEKAKYCIKCDEKKEFYSGKDLMNGKLNIENFKPTFNGCDSILIFVKEC